MEIAQGPKQKRKRRLLEDESPGTLEENLAYFKCLLKTMGTFPLVLAMDPPTSGVSQGSALFVTKVLSSKVVDIEEKIASFLQRRSCFLLFYQKLKL